MDTRDKVRRFVARPRPTAGTGRDVPRLTPGTLPFVTVASESGAGGHVFADALLELLAGQATAHADLGDWHAFDKAMCGEALEDERLASAMDDLLEERYHSQIGEFVAGLYGDGGMQNATYARLAKLLRTIASVGRVVILGHGGFMATRELAGGTHVRLVAPLAVRAARLAPRMGVDEARATPLIRERDEARRKLLRTHYRIDATGPEHYDLVCNTARMSPRTAAGLVVSLLLRQVG